MTLPERQLAVALLLTLTLGARWSAHQLAGGVMRDQSDGLARENGPVLAVVVRLVFLAALLGVGVWLVRPALLFGSVVVPTWAARSGLVLATSGTVGLLWVQQALGVHVSGTLHLRDDHRLVQAGPYARVRHPMYTAFIALFLGLSLLIGNLWIAGILLGSQVWTVFWRLPHEEASLEERFGVAWVAYRGRTGTLTPWF